MSQYTVYDPDYVPTAFGLSNTGAICWCNSALQMLFSCSSFNQRMLDCADTDKIKKSLVALVYIKFLRDIRAGTIDNSMSVKLINAIVYDMRARKRESEITGFGQQCPDEGIQLILDLIDYNHINSLFNHRYFSASWCHSCKTTSYINNTEPPNIVLNYTFEKPINTHDAFRDYIYRHVIPNNEMKCDNCKQTGPGHNVYKLRLLSEVIIIRIQNTNSGLLSRDNIWYPEQLTFGAVDGADLKYQLVSVIHHFGAQRMSASIVDGKLVRNFSSSGHYVADCLRDGKWKNFNDSNVSDTTFAPKSTAYILMYHMVK
jgi:ubiquitin C-terminal hydrolase